MGKYKAVLVASLMFWFQLNFGEMIADEINIGLKRTNTTYLFLYLITRLCEDDHVLINTGVDNRVKITKTHSFDRSRDEERPTLSLVKS